VIFTSLEQLAFSKAHLLPYVFPSEPHTGENSFVHIFGQPSSSGVLPKAMISSKVSGAEKSIWTITYLPDASCPDIVIISPSAAGPSKWPSWVPPVNFSVAEVGSSSDTITYTWRVTLPQQLILLKISTFSTRTSVP